MAVKDEGGKSLGFQTCSRGPRPPLDAGGVQRANPRCAPRAEGAGHAVLVPDNERPAGKQQARSCQRQAGATVPGIGGADGTLAAREASAIRLPSAIPKEVWKGTERGTIRVPGTSPSASRLICPAAPGPLPPTPLDGGEARALEDKSLRSAGPPLTALRTGSRPRPS